jgi:hypothetical protein
MNGDRHTPSTSAIKRYRILALLALAFGVALALLPNSCGSTTTMGWSLTVLAKETEHR